MIKLEDYIFLGQLWNFFNYLNLYKKDTYKFIFKHPWYYLSLLDSFLKLKKIPCNHSCDKSFIIALFITRKVLFIIVYIKKCEHVKQVGTRRFRFILWLNEIYNEQVLNCYFASTRLVRSFDNSVLDFFLWQQLIWRIAHKRNSSR